MLLRYSPDWFAGAEAVLLSVYPYVAFFALFQPPAPQVGIPLIEDCSESAPVLANLSRNAPVEVRSSVAGYTKTCYAVTAVVGGKPVRGYVLGDGLAAVAEFERQRTAVAASIEDVAPAPVAAPAAPAAPAASVVKAPSIPVEKLNYPPFRDFSAIDMKGKAVGVHSLKGKVFLVCFWTPGNKASFREFLTVSGLYGQFQKQGVDALAVSLSGNIPQIKDAVDDVRSGIHIVANGGDIAARYDVDFDVLPRTYVLNENFEIVASGLHDKALQDLVKQMVAEK